MLLLLLWISLLLEREGRREYEGREEKDLCVVLAVVVLLQNTKDDCFVFTVVVFGLFLNEFVGLMMNTLDKLMNTMMNLHVFVVVCRDGKL